MRVLSSREYEDYAAVQAAINTAQTWRDGADVLEVVRLHAWIWPRESLESAARRVHVSQSTAKRMYSRFVYEAARELGERLGRPCKIVTGKKKGRIELEYFGMDDLNALLEALHQLKH